MHRRNEADLKGTLSGDPLSSHQEMGECFLPDEATDRGHDNKSRESDRYFR